METHLKELFEEVVQETITNISYSSVRLQGNIHFFRASVVEELIMFMLQEKMLTGHIDAVI